MKSVQECWQTWETPEIVSQSVPQITVATEVYMRSPWPVGLPAAERSSRLVE
jgi:hypothetical protein